MSQDVFSYSFSPEEIKELVRFMRRNETEFTGVMARFYTTAERHVYNSLTLEEAERFFYE